jgi:regulator of cell morphogenesis and NO signaling
MSDLKVESNVAGRPLSDLVKENVRAAVVFEQFGLDYCCHGQQTLEEAVRDRSVSLDAVMAALESLGPAAPGDQGASVAPLDELTRLIVSRHHAYVRESIPAITAWLAKLATRHGGRHAELAEVRDTFAELADELTTHMAKEENILFPYIEALAATQRGGQAPLSPFGTIQNPVRVMEADHQLAGKLLEKLRKLTAGYQPPADGCTTYQACYAELARFEADLHRHIHLENNVLFPRALEAEGAI